jgi:drug/metabolite transporter (DMT)-like permease
MGFIFAAALCSVWVSILLKIAKQQGYQPLEMISWNYLSASLLCWLWFQPDFSHISVTHTPWWLILALGIALPSIFLCLSQSLSHAGILKTEIAQRLSVILSLTAAYFIFNESFNSLKLLGVVLGLVAIALILYSHRGDQESTSSTSGLKYLVLVWFGYALIDVLLKYTTGLGLQFAVALNLMFICAFVLSLLFIRVKYQTWGSGQNILAGLMLGCFNFANIALYVKAHLLLKDSPAIVFAGMNILVVVFGVLVGVVFFQEKLKQSSVLGLIFALLSVFCLAFAMSR